MDFAKRLLEAAEPVVCLSKFSYYSPYTQLLQPPPLPLRRRFRLLLELPFRLRHLELPDLMYWVELSWVGLLCELDMVLRSRCILR